MFANKSIKDTYNRLLEVRRQQMGYGPGFVKEEDSPYGDNDSGEMTSDIQQSWVDGTDAHNDIREFLVWLMRETEDELKVSDMIDGITNGVEDAKKILHL